MDSERLELDDDASVALGEEGDVVEAKSGENLVSADDTDELIVPAARLTRADRHRRTLLTCNQITGDRLCFMPPFKWRCECGVAGCWNGHCQCKFCG
ncbi:hypothetical protein AAVH_27202 [Aphelenchoides avenae]|nr:hypothetical protein AAVH_27202 [Aphelenchus avenae]